jgi:hypothetical protein
VKLGGDSVDASIMLLVKFIINRNRNSKLCCGKAQDDRLQELFVRLR